jgi:hypothetical protein
LDVNPLLSDFGEELDDFEEQEVCEDASEPEYVLVMPIADSGCDLYVCAECGSALALVAARPGGHMVFAQSPGLPGDMNALVRTALAMVGGKGGGTRDFAQGSCPDPAVPNRLEAILQSAAAHLIPGARAAEKGAT